MKRFCTAILIVALMAVLSSSESHASGDLDIYRERLANGMVIMLAERRAVPVVTVEMIVAAGSIMERPGQAGLANLTADLLNEGTATRSAQDINTAIEYVGGSLNTSGGYDFATVSLTVLKKDIDLGFSLLSDIVLNPSFQEEEIERRKTLIKNSIISQREDPGTVASKAFIKAVFGAHPYGYPVEGTEETVDVINRDEIVTFHREHYVPGSAIIAVAGDMDKDELIAYIRKYFEKWESRTPKQPEVPSSECCRSREVVKIQKRITQANVIIGHGGVRRDNPDYYALSVMNFILGGGGFSSRLMDNIRDNLGLSYDVHSFYSARKYGGSFQAGLQTKNASANRAISEILAEIERMKTEPVSENELADAKSYLTGSFPLRIDSNAEIARFLVSVEYYDLGTGYISDYGKLIDAVTREDVQRVAGRYLDTEKIVIVVVANQDEADIEF